jgi:hypothetical protein
VFRTNALGDTDSKGSKWGSAAQKVLIIYITYAIISTFAYISLDQVVTCIFLSTMPALELLLYRCTYATASTAVTAMQHKQ